MKKNILKRIQRRIIYFFQRCRWPFYVLRGFEGTNVGDNCSESLVVSLTSYPKRIDKVHIVIKSLLMQSKKTDRLILWLAVTDFPKREVELPSKLAKFMTGKMRVEKMTNGFTAFKRLLLSNA